LFNGGLASFPVVQTFQFQDYQGGPTIAWKSLPLAMFVTQRGLLYALPAALLLLYQWRAKFFPDYREPALAKAASTAEVDPGLDTTTPTTGTPIPFWVELSLYATMPLYHVHTFMAVTIVAGFLFLLGNWQTRKQLALLVGAALIPATFCVWIISDHFQAGSVVQWKPGWVQNAAEFAMPFVQFWLVNFGAWVPLILFFIGITAWTVCKQIGMPDFKIPAGVAFLIPAGAIFLIGYFVKLAPWEWDNIKIIVWAYFIILPFLWTDLVAHWPLHVRGLVCVGLFASGFVTLFGGLAAGKTGYGLADRAELDAVGVAVRKLPTDARYAGFPTYNHPILLQGRKMVLGYPGHLWTQGFDYSEPSEKLQQLMEGAPNWKQLARDLHARYLFWGREEKANYLTSRRPWEHEAALVASGEWGALYDLEAPPKSTPGAPTPGQ
jgi:hypothetical protein